MKVPQTAVWSTSLRYLKSALPKANEDVFGGSLCRMGRPSVTSLRYRRRWNPCNCRGRGKGGFTAVVRAAFCIFYIYVRADSEECCEQLAVRSARGRDKPIVVMFSISTTRKDLGMALASSHLSSPLPLRSLCPPSCTPGLWRIGYQATEKDHSSPKTPAGYPVSNLFHEETCDDI